MQVQGEYLKSQGESLKSQGESLKSQGESLKSQGDELKNVDMKFNSAGGGTLCFDDRSACSNIEHCKSVRIFR